MSDSCTNKSRAVSPVVAVILMVAITVILSAVIGTFVLDLGQQSTSGSQRDLGVRLTADQGELNVQVVTGSSDALEIYVNGNLTRTVSTPEPGDVASISYNSGDTVSIVSVEEGERMVVSSQTFSGDSTILGPTNELISYWEFDDTSDSEVARDTLGTYDANISGATYTSGRVDSALAFNGTSDRVIDTFQPADINNWTGVTVSFWYKPKTVTPSGSTTSWDDVMLSARYDEFTVAIDSTGKFRWQMYDGSYHYVQSSTTPQAGVWYHITVTGGSGDGMQIYVNGTLENSSAYTGLTRDKSNPRDRLQIGNVNSYWGSAGAHGSIDDFRVYTRVLNSSEINTIYTETK